MSPNKTVSVLIADDDRLFVNYLRELISNAPPLYVSCYAYDGREALQVAKANEPAAAVLDIDMPVMDGVELAGELRRLFPRMVIVMLTGTGDPKQHAEAIRQGADIVLHKQEFAKQMVAALGTKHE